MTGKRKRRIPVPADFTILMQAFDKMCCTISEKASILFLIQIRSKRGRDAMDGKKFRKIAGTAADVTAMGIGSVLRLALRIVLTVLMVFIITALLFAFIFAYYVKTELNPKLKVTLEDASLSLSSTVWYTDAAGKNIELQTLTSRENRIWVDYENLPAGMEHALVSIEDHRFYDHKGVDWYRTAGAFAQMFLSMANDFGGSTINQQLI